MSDRVVKRGRSYRVRVDGAERVRAGDHVDVLATLVNPATKGRVTVTLLHNIIVLRRNKGGWLALLLIPRESEQLALASRIASLYVVRRHPKDVKMDQNAIDVRPMMSTRSMWQQEELEADQKRRLSQFQKRILRTKKKRSVPGLLNGAREICLPLQGADDVVGGDYLDVVATVRDATAADWVSFTLASDVVVSDNPIRPSPPETASCVPLLLISRECRRAVQALRLGTLSASLRNRQDGIILQKAYATTRRTILHGVRSNCVMRGRSRTTIINRIKIYRHLPGRKRAKPPQIPPRTLMRPLRTPRPRRP